MDFKIEKIDLIKGINTAIRAVGGNNSRMPILKCMLLEASEGDHAIKLTCNNLDLGIQTASINADVVTSGDVALDARRFSEIVKLLPDEYVHISVENNFVTTIKSGKSEYKISGFNPEEFPELLSVKRENSFSIKRGVLREMISRTIFSIAEESSKPVFSGELIEVDNGQINIVAVDGYRISHRFLKKSSDEQSFNVVVPGKSLGEIVKLLAGLDDNDVQIYFSNNLILFEFEECKVISRLLEGDFLRYSSAFNIEHTTAVKTGRKELLSCLERASLIADDSGKLVTVCFDIKDDSITITATNNVGTAHEETAAEIEGDNVSILFNAKLLIDALKAIEDDIIVMQYKGPLTACIIRQEESGESTLHNDRGNYEYLILPLKR